MPLPVKLDKVPPITVMSDATKLVDASLKVKVKVAESPPCRVDLLLATAMVGSRVSTVRVSKLLASEPSALAFPAASMKASLATQIVPLVVLLADGVKRDV